MVGELADADGELSEVLIDGRNRRAACRIAGVEPAVRRLTGGEDATAYVLSANIHRRHMTKGQRAMAVAMIYPEGERGGRGRVAETRQKATGLSRTQISNARLVVNFAPDLVPNVLSGSTSLDEAYKAAQQRKEAASSAEARIAALRARYPELADRVVEGELTIAGAFAEADARDARKREARASVLLGVTPNPLPHPSQGRVLRSDPDKKGSRQQTPTPSDCRVSHYHAMPEPCTRYNSLPSSVRLLRKTIALRLKPV